MYTGFLLDKYTCCMYNIDRRDIMKTEIIRIGTPSRGDVKYMGGKFPMRVLVLEGTPEEVAAASELRYAKLNECAAELQDFFVSCFSMRMLDERFAEEHVTSLKELLLKQVQFRNYYLLSLTSARKILEAAEQDII